MISSFGFGFAYWISWRFGCLGHAVWLFGFAVDCWWLVCGYCFSDVVLIVLHISCFVFICD